MRLRLDHVALTVSDRERSAASYGEHLGLTTRLHDDELQAAGVPEAEWQDTAGMVRVQIRDPDGYLIDLYAFWPAPRDPLHTSAVPRARTWTEVA